MFIVHREELSWGGKPLVLETGKVARQADGAVLATYGETTVLCTVVADKKAKPDVDFFPLSVHYQEKTFAAGRIPGGFFKREGKPSEKEVLVSRLVDRPIRPLFPKEFKNETQVICTVLSYDTVNESDIVALVGASAALTLSGIPFLGPVGAARVGYKDGKYILNPSREEIEASVLDLVVAGTSEGVLMVESEAHELSEEVMLGAVTFGHEAFQEVIQAIIRLAEKAAKDPWELPEPFPHYEEIKKKVHDIAEENLQAAFKEPEKQKRYTLIQEAWNKVEEAFASQEGIPSLLVDDIFKTIKQDIVRNAILDTGHRIDGRTTKDIRNIECVAPFLPRAHGSALFTRGETQALVVATLGTGEDEQIIDALEGEYRENFLLHYNFPPFSVGEVGRFGSPGRREVGHGKLAWRAIHPLLPTKEAFPYTIRVVSEITESNGSSSMATVCGTSLAMMDAGVPLPRPVAGIAMGLIKEGNRIAILSDILGDEDHLGDMDFKVAGTDKGITALQMDIKITSITKAIMQDALMQALEGRKHILGEMKKAIEKPREALSAYAPRIHTIQVPKDKIREVIGTGGKVIRDICETTGVKMEIDDDGTTRVAGTDLKSIEAALERIQSIIAEPEINRIYTGKVVKTADFGAFVAFLGNYQGLVHISELAPGRVAKVTDVVNVGDEVRVKVLAIDDQGKVRLSIKAVDAPAQGAAEGA